MGDISLGAMRLARAAAVLFASILFAAACASVSAEEAGPRRIVAVGDLHGDWAAYEDIMQAAGLIDRRGRWSGGDTVFVQTGDVPDRGPDSRRIIEHLKKLEKQAPRKGGDVIALVGNHEAMNMTGDLRYVDAGEYEAFRTRNSASLRDAYFDSQKEQLAAFYRGRNPEMTDDEVRAAFEADAPPGYLEHRLAWSAGGEIGEWVAENDAVSIVGDTLFVHGGISAAYSGAAIDAINSAVRAALKGEGDAAILTEETGPLWYRGNAEEFEGGDAEVAAALANFGVKRIVVGHTPSLEGIAQRYDGRVIVIDTGAAAYYGGTRSFLEIVGECVRAHDNDAVRILEGACQ